MLCSLIMSSFCRSELLRYSLSSILRNKPDFPLEIIVVNDGMNDDTNKVCEEFTELNIKYCFAGHRNIVSAIPRNPGRPNNIAFKHSTGDIVIMSCPEVYHLNSAVSIVAKPVMDGMHVMSIPNFIYMDDGQGVEELKSSGQIKTSVTTLRRLYDCVEMPFFMAIHRSDFDRIGGYDEDMTGYAGEDNDFVARLKLAGLSHYKVGAEVVHLYHGHRGVESAVNLKTMSLSRRNAWLYNQRVANSREGTIIRNSGKEWGQI